MVSQTIAPVSLPLPPALPLDFAYRAQDIISSTGSGTTAFCTAISKRDVFGGVPRCVVCGESLDLLLDNWHIIQKDDKSMWQSLKKKHYLPDTVKTVEHESRNGVKLCLNHQRYLDTYQAFIRYVRECDRYIFINYCGSRTQEVFHGKAVGLNSADVGAPFPIAFLIHEIRTRGFHPFQPTNVDIASPVPWQDWLYARQLIDSTGNISRSLPNHSFSGDSTGNLSNQFPSLIVEPSTTSNCNTVRIAMTPDTIQDIVEATKQLPTWRACKIEGLTWDGTAAQNIEKYEKEVGFEPVDQNK